MLRLPPLHPPEAGHGDGRDVGSSSQNDTGVGQSPRRTYLVSLRPRPVRDAIPDTADAVGCFMSPPGRSQGSTRLMRISREWLHAPATTASPSRGGTR